MNRPVRRRSTVVLLVVATAVGVAPLYPLFWWWDVLAHALATLAVIRVLREFGCDWEATLFVLVGVSLLFEVAEYHAGVFITGYLDTLVDLSVNVTTWGVVRVASAVEVGLPVGTSDRAD